MLMIAKFLRLMHKIPGGRCLFVLEFLFGLYMIYINFQLIAFVLKAENKKVFQTFAYNIRCLAFVLILQFLKFLLQYTIVGIFA